MAIASALPRATSGVSADTATVAEALLASVVLVRSGWGSGSGVIWEPDGLIVTNSHVVHADTADVILRDGTRYAGRLVARNPARDLAALRIDATGLPAARVGDSSRLHVGQVVLAVGNPLGLRGAVTAGIITGIGQVATQERTRLDDLIQADVALAPGNSGGPLADAAGRVLGINSMISATGIALAVPVAAVQAFLAPQRKDRPYLGISGMAVHVRAAGQTRGGVLLTTVEDGSPAERAGLMQGDVVLGFDGRDLQSDDDLHAWLAGWEGGKPVELAVLRGQEPREFTVVPATQAAV